MANTNYVQLPAVTGLDGTEVVSLVQPGTSAGTDKKATTRQLMAATLPNLSAGAVPTTNFLVPLVKVSDGLAYSVSVSTFLTALHGVPAGGTTGQILGKVSGADYDINWQSAGTVFSVGLSMPAVFTVTNSPVTGSGVLTVTANGTSGGIPYFNAATTMASSAALAANQIVLGGGAGTTPATLGSLGTTSTLLHGNAAGAPTFAAVTLTTDVTGTLPVANGGTGVNAITAHYLLVGNGTSATTLLAPSSTSGIPLVSQGASSDPAYSTAVVAGGGTGLTSATAYAVLCGGTSSTGAFQSIAGVGTSGQALVSNGASALPTFQTVAAAGITVGTTVITSGTTTRVLYDNAGVLGEYAQIPLAVGGTNAALTASNGGIFYSTASAGAILSGTATANQIILSGASTTPAWSTATYPATVTVGTILNAGSANVLSATATPTLGASGTLGTLAFGNATSGTVKLQPVAGALGSAVLSLPAITDTLAGTALANGGTNAALTASNGGIVYSSASALAILSGTATASLPLLSAASTTPTWATVSYPTSATSGGIPYFSSTSAMATSALLTQFGPIYGGGAGATPVAMAAATDGQVIVGQTSAAPLWKTASGDLTVAASGAFTIGANKVTYAKFQQEVGLTLLGVGGSSTANYGALTGTANQLPFVNSGGTALAFGALSTLLDNTLSSTQGSVIYRGASTWSALGPGSSGSFLQTQGAGLNPAWAAAAGGGSVTAVTASPQGLTINGIGGAAGGSFNVSGTLTPIQTINAQTGTTYTVLTTDHTKLITFNNASPCAVTLPQANGAGFSQGFWFEAENYGAGLVTITPTTSTIDSATLFYVGQNQGIKVTSDGTNYQVKRSVVQPGLPVGRLTLTSGVQVMTATVSGATTIYYTPYNGVAVVPVYNGSSWVPIPYAELSQTTADATKSPAAVGTIGSATNVPAAYDLFVWVDSGTVRCTRGPAWTTATSGTAIVSVASPGVVTWTGHGLKESAPVIFTGAGLPTGLTAGTTYYVSKTSLAANSFVVSTSIANAAAGTNVNTSGSSTGTQTATNNDSVRGTGAGTTQLTLTNGIYLNTVAITNGPGALRGTYLGTVRSNASSQIDFILGGVAAGGTAAVLGVWNAYNRRPVMPLVADSTASWTYATTTWRSADASTTNRISFVQGLSEDAVSAVYNVQAQAVGNACETGIAFDSTTTLSAASVIGYCSVGSANLGAIANYAGYPGTGYHYCQAMEYASGATATFYGGAVNGAQEMFLSATLQM